MILFILSICGGLLCAIGISAIFGLPWALIFFGSMLLILAMVKYMDGGIM